MKIFSLSFFHHFLIVLHLRSPPSARARIKDGGKRNEEKMKIFGKTSRENENEMKKKNEDLGLRHLKNEEKMMTQMKIK